MGLFFPYRGMGITEQLPGLMWPCFIIECIQSKYRHLFHMQKPGVNLFEKVDSDVSKLRCMIQESLKLNLILTKL